MTEPMLTEHGRRMAQDDRTLPIVIYALFLLGLGNGLTILIGFILAYVLKRGAVEPARSHYVFQIRSVWIALAGFALAAVVMMFAFPLTFILVGFALMPVAGVVAGLTGALFAIRSVIGLIFVARGQSYPRPDAWLF